MLGAVVYSIAHNMPLYTRKPQENYEPPMVFIFDSADVHSGFILRGKTFCCWFYIPVNQITGLQKVMRKCPISVRKENALKIQNHDHL